MYAYTCICICIHTKYINTSNIYMYICHNLLRISAVRYRELPGSAAEHIVSHVPQTASNDAQSDSRKDVGVVSLPWCVRLYAYILCVCMHVCMYVRMYVCMYVYVCVCVCIYIYIMSMSEYIHMCNIFGYIYIYIYIHTYI